MALLKKNGQDQKKASNCVLSNAQVRKSYEERRRKRHVKGQGRSWKLKRMAMDTDDAMQLKKGQQAQADRRQQDLERFMQVTPCLHPPRRYATPLMCAVT